MHRFHFQLDPLLRQRRREERDAQIALAAVERERAEIQGQADRLIAAAESAKDALRRSLDPNAPKRGPNDTPPHPPTHTPTHTPAHTPQSPAATQQQNPSNAGIDPTAARWQATAAGAADARARQLAISLAGVLKRRDEARDKLANAATRRRAVESLRERRLADFNAELARKEAAQTDDINNARTARNIALAHHRTRPAGSKP